MFWGTTPALNLFDELPTEKSTKKVLNILLIGGSDARHILKTIAKKYHHPDVTLNFYIMEIIPEVYAKQILLLNLALQPVKTFGIVHKTRTFMEIYGNTLIRPPSARYLTQRAEDLVEMITDLERMKKSMPNLTIELKYKERDYIENVFKFWASCDKFDVLDCWDRRLRKHLGVRYDTRHAAFDWDLHMNLQPAGAKKLNTQEYQSFRRHGVAFAWLESEVTRVNRSMVTGVVLNGGDFGHYGYLGDMLTGPFIAYGLECADEEFSKKSNNVYKYRCTDVTERNLREIFHEIEFGTEYEHHATSSMTLGSTLMAIPSVRIVETGNAKEIMRKHFEQCLTVPDVTVTMVSMSSLKLWKDRARYRGLFDVVYLTNLFAMKNVDGEVLASISDEKCALIVENPLYGVVHRAKDLEEHAGKVEALLGDIPRRSCPFDFKTDAYLKYILK